MDPTPAHPGPARLLLVAGSGRAQRAPTPVEPLMAELRAQFGHSFTPPPARLGERSERSGKAETEAEVVLSQVSGAIDGKLLQVGGDATTGRGLVSARVLRGNAN